MIRIVKKPEVRKQEIIATARRLFQTKSYDKTSMQDVIDELGIAKGTIYHYFECKKDLLIAVIEDVVQEDIARKHQLIKNTQGNALNKIRTLVEMGSMAQDNDKILEQLHQPGNIGMHTQLLAVTLMKEAPLFGDLIRQGCKEGLFQTDTPLECAEFILTAIQFLTDAGIYPWVHDDLLRRVQAFPALIEALLKAPRGSFQFLVKRL